MYNDEEKLLKLTKSSLFCLFMMLVGAFLGWEPAILLVLSLIYVKET
jgi:hypothetical protein